MRFGGRRGPLLLLLVLLCLAWASDAGAGPSSWSVVKVDPHAGLVAVSCPAKTLCVAGDTRLGLLSTVDPGGGASAWHRFTGRSYPGDDGNPNAYQSQPSLYTGVACPSVALCIAVDDGGDILSSTDAQAATRSAWHGALVDCGECMMVADGRLTDVSCASTTACVATDPIAGYGESTSSKPKNVNGGWNSVSVSGTPYGVACDPRDLCVLFGQGNGTIFESTTPTATKPAFQRTVIDAGHGIRGVSCPSLSLCVAVDDSGNVITSTDPTSPSPRWNIVDVDGSTALKGISCPSRTLCVAVDSTGHVVASTDPTGSAAAWRVTEIDGNRVFKAISCPSVSLCVAVDRNGYVATTANPRATAGH